MTLSLRSIVKTAALLLTLGVSCIAEARWYWDGARWVFVQVATNEAYSYARPYVIQGGRSAANTYGQAVYGGYSYGASSPVYGSYDPWRGSGGSTRAYAPSQYYQNAPRPARVCRNQSGQTFYC
jgi:hypothetical protein